MHGGLLCLSPIRCTQIVTNSAANEAAKDSSGSNARGAATHC